MNRSVYIRSARAISPQHSFYPEALLTPLMHSEDGKLFAVDINYHDYIGPVAIRRMGRMLKMTISAGMQSLADAGLKQPDAIVTGTGRGSMNDTERFLGDMIDREEQALNPTYFIQSTYNSPNGWLAMQTGCTAYNQTYVHRGASFEWALLDALMLLEEGKAQHVLAGCFDELTHDYFFVKDKVDYWKRPTPPSLALLQHADTPGTIAGEGSAFFVLSSNPEGRLATLHDLKLLNDPASEEIRQQTDTLLRENGLTYEDIDLVIAGINGDVNQQYIYDAALSGFGPTTTQIGFKHLCGEYDTSGGFALWLATELLRRQEIPEYLILHPGNRKKIETILVVNHYILKNVSLTLISR
jgi:hypothetical protein